MNQMKAVTICNVNRALKSEALKVPPSSGNYPVLQSICGFTVGNGEDVNVSFPGKWSVYREVLLNVRKHF